jgi:ABC-type branched-subunit amino acid transport system permease subunit
MTSATPRRSAVWPAILAVVAATVFCYLFLRVEHEWEVAALAVVALGALFAFGRTRLSERIDEAWTTAPGLLGGLTFAAGIGLIAAFAEDHFALLMLTKVMLFALVCLGLTLQFGFAGVLNFSAAAFFGIGGYTAAKLAGAAMAPHLLVLLLGGLVAAAVGSVLILPLLRTRGHYAALITVAFALLFKTLLELTDALGGPQGLKVPGIEILGWSFNSNIEVGEDLELSFYVNYALLALLLLAGGLVLVRRVERSWLGLSMDAVRIDETSASVFGFEIARWKIFAFTLGNFLAGVAGAVYAMLTGFVAPASYTLSESLIFVSIVILGGMGNVAGVLPATALVVLVPEKLQVIQEYRFLLFSALVIAVLLFRPAGLLPRRLRAYLPGWGRPHPIGPIPPARAGEGEGGGTR